MFGLDVIRRFALLSLHAQLWINHDAKQSATIAHAPQFIE
jgi:hypothetical protein